MVSRKASAPKRAAATQKLTKKSAAATAKKAESAAKAKKTAAAKTKKTKATANAIVESSADKQRADTTALATASGGADGGGKHSDRGKVLYVGHLPHGFYEEQLRGYFSQFGAVTRVRLSRVKRTGKPKSYAFLEFANPAVASIAAGAMDGYLMFSQRLSVKVIPPDAVHPALFKGANRTFTKVPWKEIERKRANKKLTAEEAKRRKARAAKRDGERAARIRASGIDYEYERIVEDFAQEKKASSSSSPSSSRAKKAKAEEDKAAAPAKRARTTKTTATATAKAATAAAPKAAAAAKKATATAAAAPKKATKRSTSVVAAAAVPIRSSKRSRG